MVLPHENKITETAARFNREGVLPWQWKDRPHKRQICAANTIDSSLECRILAVAAVHQSREGFLAFRQYDVLPPDNHSPPS